MAQLVPAGTWKDTPARHKMEDLVCTAVACEITNGLLVCLMLRLPQYRGHQMVTHADFTDVSPREVHDAHARMKCMMWANAYHLGWVGPQAGT